MTPCHHQPRIEADEPMGIVISRGTSEERPPVFSAYVWGPAPEDVHDLSAPTAAR